MSEQSGVAPPDWLNVSRETMERFSAFVSLLMKWNPAINLISRRSVAEVWDRHLLDSAQLFSLVPARAETLVDLGSGGGFPGLILAIMAHDERPDLRVTLVEADLRKAAFLSEAARQLDLRTSIAAQRIEVLSPQQADVLTARALAPLVTLCGFADRHLDRNGIALFSKGASVEDEINQARLIWSFDVARHRSKSDNDATLLALTDVRHA